MSCALDHVSDADILSVIASGKVQAGRVGNIRHDLGIACSAGALRNRLCRMERSGLIERDPYYSAVNSIYWRVVKP